MTSRPSAAAALAITGLAVFTIWITWRAKGLESRAASHDRSGELLNKSAPAFALRSLDGRDVSLADYRGKKSVVLSFWASWCGPCRTELPMLKKFYRRMHKPDSDFEILTVVSDDDREPAQAYAREAGLPFPVLVDSDAKTSDAYLVSAIPALFVIDKSGTITFARIGVDTSLEFMLAQRLGMGKYTPGTGDDDAGGN
jgi:peroxiredoxin